MSNGNRDGKSDGIDNGAKSGNRKAQRPSAVRDNLLRAAGGQSDAGTPVSGGTAEAGTESMEPSKYTVLLNGEMAAEFRQAVEAIGGKAKQSHVTRELIRVFLTDEYTRALVVDAVKKRRYQ